MENAEKTLTSCMSTLFRVGKWYWEFGLTMNTLVALTPAITYMCGLSALVATCATIVVHISSNYLKHLGEKYTDKANSALRSLEEFDGFGFSLSHSQLHDCLAAAAQFKSSDVEGPYFASTAEVGPNRVLENLRQSAQSSKVLSERMAYRILSYLVLLAIVVAVTTVVGLQTDLTHSDRAELMIGLTAIFAFVSSANLFQLTVAYFKFSHECKNLLSDVENSLSLPQIPDHVAHRLLREYCVSRVSAPPLPEWKWKKHREEISLLSTVVKEVHQLSEETPTRRSVGED